VDLVKTKDESGSDKKIFGPGPREIKKYRPGPGSGHARSFLTLTHIAYLIMLTQQNPLD